MTTAESIVITAPAPAPADSDALAEATHAATQMAQAAAAIAQAAAASPENNHAQELNRVFERLGVLEGMFSSVHEKLDAIREAILLLTLAEAAEAEEEAAEFSGDDGAAIAAIETQAALAETAAEVVAETIPDAIPETPQIRAAKSRRFV